MTRKIDDGKSNLARYRERNKEAGRCIYCPQPRCEGSRTLCKKHLEDARVYQARVREGFRKYCNQMAIIEKGGKAI